MNSWDYQGEYLNQFETLRRSTVGNLFCYAVRADCADIDAILDYVMDACTGKFQDTQDKFYLQIVDSLTETEARNFADHILWRETLPPLEKSALKKATQKPYAQQSMAGKPVTDAQKWKLKQLGITTVPKDRLEASQLIDANTK